MPYSKCKSLSINEDAKPKYQTKAAYRGKLKMFLEEEQAHSLASRWWKNKGGKATTLRCLTA
jgi:hypothetical protein